MSAPVSTRAIDNCHQISKFAEISFERTYDGVSLWRFRSTCFRNGESIRFTSIQLVLDILRNIQDEIWIEHALRPSKIARASGAAGGPW